MIRSVRQTLVRASFAAFGAVPLVTVTGQGQAAAATVPAGVGATLTPSVGILIAGNWYDGPIGTNLSATNAPIFGVQGGLPLTRGVALVGNLAFAAADLRIGLPLLGGIDVGSANTWLYDVALELGGLSGRTTGLAPFVQAGLGGLSYEIKNRFFDTRATNIAYTVGVGVDVGVSEGFAIRVQAKDWISRFNSEDATGFRAEGNLAHNIAITAGVRFSF